MKKIGIIVFIVAVLIGVVFSNLFSFGKASERVFNVSFNLGGEKGTGNVVTETRDIKGFDSIDVSGVFHVEIVAQKDFSVEVEADDNLLKHIKTEVNGGVLEISTDKRIKSHSTLKLRISAPDIKKIEASGVSRVSLTNVKNTGLEVDTSGASKINLSGETDKLVVEVSGASNIDAENLRSRSASIDASGASKVSVFATESIRSDASGASKIVYSGGAIDVVKKTSGASSVSQK